MKKPLYKDERGLAQIVIILLVLVVLAAVGFAGWRVMQNRQNDKKPAAAKTSSGKTFNSTCLKIYNDKNLCYAAAASADFTKLSYTAVDTSTSAQGQTSTLTLQNDGKGSSSLTTSGGGQAISTITIGDSVYTKAPGSDSWTKYTSAAVSGAAATANPSSDLKTQFSDTSTPASKRIQYKSLGTEKCGYANCYKYQVTDPAVAAGTTNYVWFSTSNYRLQRWYEKNATATDDFVITYGSVKIVAPSPVTAATAVPAAQ